MFEGYRRPVPAYALICGKLHYVVGLQTVNVGSMSGHRLNLDTVGRAERRWRSSFFWNYCVLSANDLTKTSLILKVMIDVRKERARASYKHAIKEKSLRRLDEWANLGYSRIMTTLTEGFPCFFLSCKANARVKPVKTGHGLHSS
jgi:hypothetical protein